MGVASNVFGYFFVGCLVLCFGTIGFGQTVAETTPNVSEIPAAKTQYLGRVIAPTMTFHGAPWLIRPERRDEERPDLVMQNLRLKSGMRVCDMGCGNGYYTMRIANAVGKKGTVYAVDIQPEMLQMLRENMNRAKVDNIEPILSEAHDPHLPEGKVDLLLMVDVYHEFSHPDTMLQAISKSLAPGGMIALLEFREEDPMVPIKPLHKMSKVQIMKEYEANGYKLVRSFDGLPWQHMMFFGRSNDQFENATEDATK